MNDSYICLRHGPIQKTPCEFCQEELKSFPTHPIYNPSKKISLEDVWNSDDFHNAKTTAASKTYGVGPLNGAFKEGWEQCCRWFLENLK